VNPIPMTSNRFLIRAGLGSLLCLEESLCNYCTSTLQQLLYDIHIDGFSGFVSHSV
jgi:hypothetical protein